MSYSTVGWGPHVGVDTWLCLKSIYAGETAKGIKISDKSMITKYKLFDMVVLYDGPYRA
jgi:hypothetical protein